MTDRQDRKTAKNAVLDLISLARQTRPQGAKKIAGIAILLIAVLASLPAHASEEGLPPLEGIWFTCEFAKSRTPPHDGCAMFDDEGFRFDEGRLTYIRVTDSDETKCRGGKVGQCFSRDQTTVTIKTQDRGELNLGDDWITVRYLGCTQKYSFADTLEYREITPAEDRCFWARKRHFYIARFAGNVLIQR